MSTYSYPLTFPTVIGIRSWGWSMENADGRNLSPTSFKEQIYSHPGEKWGITITFPPLALPIAKTVLGFLAALNGAVGTFTYPQPAPYGDPLVTTLAGQGGGTPVVNGGNQSGKMLITDGWPISTSNILKAGDFFQCDGQLYMNMVNVNSDGSGNATLDIFPTLLTQPADNSPISLSNPCGIFRLASSKVEWSGSIDGVVSISIDAVSAI